MLVWTDCGHLLEKIIPIFEEFKLQGIKSKEFEDFKKAALIIKDKTHLTREGLDEVKKIKGRMNKNRKNTNGYIT